MTLTHTPIRTALPACVGSERLDPAEALLAACAASAFRPVHSRELPDTGLDWPRIVVGAVRHGVGQLAWPLLRSAHLAAHAPQACAAVLNRLRPAVAHRNRIMLRECARIVRALEAAGIPCLLLKGPALALTAYRSLEDRCFSDVDLLVPAEAFAAACAAAERAGFRPLCPLSQDHDLDRKLIRDVPDDILTASTAWELDPLVTPRLLREHRHRVAVEVHRGVLRDPGGFARSVDTSPMWSEARIVAIADGTPVRVPGPEAMLAHLCGHAAQHAWTRLVHPMDVGICAARWGPEMDWREAARIARCWQVDEHLYTGLHLARTLGAPVPPEALDMAAPASPRRRASRSLPLARVLEEPEAAGRTLHVRAWMLGQGRWSRLRALARLAAPPATMMRALYGDQPRLPMPLLYLARPVHLALGALPALRQTPSR